MKKLIKIAFAVALLVSSFSAISHGADLMIEKTAQTVQNGVDKNGNPFVRLIVEDTRTLNGVTYTVGMPVMVFGAQVERAKAISPGQKFKAIVQERDYRGSKSQSVVTFVD